MAKNNKKVRRSIEPNPGKKAKNVLVPDYSKPIVWKFGDVDRKGNWGWDKVSPQELWDEILPKVQSFETMTFAQLASSRSEHHPMPVNKLSTEAQNRIIEIGLNQDDLFSFSVGAKKRLWGSTVENIFRVLWWDPKHTVFKVPKSRT